MKRRKSFHSPGNGGLHALPLEVVERLIVCCDLGTELSRDSPVVHVGKAQARGRARDWKIS